MRPMNSWKHQRHDDLLRRDLFGGWAAAHPTLQELRILFDQIKRDRERGYKIDGQEQPSLPIIEGSRRNEQQRRHDQNEDQETDESLDVQLAHPAIVTRTRRIASPIRKCALPHRQHHAKAGLPADHFGEGLGSALERQAFDHRFYARIGAEDERILRVRGLPIVPAFD